MKALKEKKIQINKEYIVVGDWSKKSGSCAMQKLLRLRLLPSAIFVSGDEMALGAIETVKERGLKIPEDISFMGFDDIPEASSQKYLLTTVKQPLEELGTLGVKYLKSFILKKNSKPVKILLRNTEIVIRKSVKNL